MSSASNELTKAIIKVLNSAGFLTWRNNTAGVYDPIKKTFRKNAALKKGVSDILGVIPGSGRILAIEVKIGSDKLSPHQHLFLNDVRDRNGSAFVAKTFDGFLESLKEHLNEEEIKIINKKYKFL